MMRAFFAILALGLLPLGALAQDPVEAAAQETVEAEPVPAGLQIFDAADVEMEDFLWDWRILAVFADTPNDPAFIRQMRDIESAPNDLFERDVVVLTDTAPRENTELRRRLRPRGFMLAIIEKDGNIAQRRPAPRDVREISAMIDRFPLRRQEMLERLPAGR